MAFYCCDKNGIACDPLQMSFAIAWQHLQPQKQQGNKSDSLVRKLQCYDSKYDNDNVIFYDRDNNANGWAGGRFKNAYELLNLRALNSMLY